MFLIFRTRTWRDLKPLTNDERRALWAARFYALGLHRKP